MLASHLVRTRAEVTPDKLRGGFYTPPALVEFCLNRASQLLPAESAIRMLEPSAGDGAFIRGIGRTATRIGHHIAAIRAIELLPEEAAKAELSLRSLDIAGGVVRGSVIRWAADTEDWFDLVAGNPPFVRYQFLSDEDKAAITRLGARLGLTLRGVGNLWIPVLLGALARLQPDGALALVLPTECFTGCSASVVRDWLGREIEGLTFDLFPPRSFPGVLQEVAVVSGRRAPEAIESPTLRIVEHGPAGASRTWPYRPAPSDRSWTRSLLDPHLLEVLNVGCGLSSVGRLERLARIEVSVVTGANGFFCVDNATLLRHRLQPWAKPLLARTRHAPGLVFDASDHVAALQAGAPTWLLDFNAAAPDPTDHDGANTYLCDGERLGLADRYKCRIRDPWYRVPSVRRGTIMLSKRSHHYPRLLVNRAEAYTTDTIYRGNMLPGAAVSAADLVASFHSSLTLLMAELEGRSFGGGVLELVPSEIARLAVINSPGFGRHLPKLDRIARAHEPEELVRATDSLLAESGVMPRDLLDRLADGRRALMARRLHRNLLSTRSSSKDEARAA